MGPMKDKPMTDDEIIAAVKALPYAKCFHVGTEAERQKALNASRYLQKRLISRKNGKGGFSIFALSES